MKITGLTLNEKSWNKFFEHYGFKGSTGRKKYYLPFKKTCALFGIKNEAAFLAQMCHESWFFKFKIENLKYSEKGLLQYFKKYFTPEKAMKYAYKDVMIGSIVYGNRYGNGGVKTKDGYKYRGRGAFALTFKDNYKALQKFLKGIKHKEKPINCVKNPDILLDDGIFFYSAAWYWLAKRCNKTNNFKKLTKIINGGYNGLEHRRKIYRTLKEICNA